MDIEHENIRRFNEAGVRLVIIEAIEAPTLVWLLTPSTSPKWWRRTLPGRWMWLDMIDCMMNY
jgi:hypothetical protein